MARMRLTAAVAVLLLLAGSAPGQEYRIDWYTINSGGAPGSNAGHMVNGSAAQAVQGLGSNAIPISASWGYWYAEPGAEPVPDPPTLISIEPNWAPPGTNDLPVTLTGTNFIIGATDVIISATDVEAHNVVVLSSTTLTAEFTVHQNAPVGYREVRVQTPYGISNYRPFWVATRRPWREGWVEMTPIPAQERNSRTMVRRGSWLAVGPGPEGQNYIYAVKGNRQQNFYRYDPIREDPELDGDPWYELVATPVPLDPVRGRPLDRGCRGIHAPEGGRDYIYVVYGNNTEVFWRYDIDYADPVLAWERMADVPLTPSGRRPRGGGYLVYVPGANVGMPDNYIYAMKGDRLDFHRYNVGADAWEELAPMPFGLRGRWDRGSWLAYDGDRTIYAHQARDFDRTRREPTHFFWKYDILSNTWSEMNELAGMPLHGLHGGRIRRRRARDGGSGAFGTDELLYALKGGNSEQYWTYNPAADTWIELRIDPLPDFSPTTGRRRRVNQGGYFTHYQEETSIGFFALKGNRTQEFWRYAVRMGWHEYEYHAEPETGPERSGVMAGESKVGAPFVSVGPNPLAGGLATLRYALPNAGPATVSVFDVSGRNVLSRSLAASRSGATSLDLRELSAGVYLVKVEADGFTQTRKLVVQQ